VTGAQYVTKHCSHYLIICAQDLCISVQESSILYRPKNQNAKMLQGDLFKRLSLDESLRRVFDVYVSGFYPFTKIAAVLVALKSILWVAIFPYLLSASNFTPEDISDPIFVLRHLEEIFFMVGPHVVLSLVVGPIAEGGMIKAVADIYAGRQPDCVACLKLGVRKALPLLMTSLLFTLAALVGFLLFFAPGLYVMVAWFVVGPAIVLENFGITGSLKRSYNLVSGNWCYVFCTLMIIHFIMIVAQMLWNSIFAGGNDLHHTLFSVTGSIIAVIPSLFVVPLFVITQTVMYFNLRVEKEELNADVLLREMGERAESDPDRVPLMDDLTPIDQGTPQIDPV
jgi:hypothetical protein